MIPVLPHANIRRRNGYPLIYKMILTYKTFVCQYHISNRARQRQAFTIIQPGVPYAPYARIKQKELANTPIKEYTNGNIKNKGDQYDY